MNENEEPPVTEAELARVAELDAKATQGPWIYDPKNERGGLAKYANAPQMVWGPSGPGYGTIATTCSDGLMPYPGGQQARDADLIAEYRTITPRLARELAAARAAIKVLESELDCLKTGAVEVVEYTRRHLEALRAQLAEREEDRKAMDMLELHEVEVRIPLRHGSRLAFRCSPVQEDEGDEDQPSNLRASIRAARAQPENGK